MEFPSFERVVISKSLHKAAKCSFSPDDFYFGICKCNTYSFVLRTITAIASGDLMP